MTNRSADIGASGGHIHYASGGAIQALSGLQGLRRRVAEGDSGALGDEARKSDF